jgi:hypothetical protein
MDLIESRSCAARLASLLKDEQHALADFLLALADFDRGRGWVELGYSGLFPFLHGRLGLSKAASFYRKTAAELLQRFPELIEPLRDGRLCLTTIGQLAKVITPENRAAVLPRFFHRSGTEAKAIVAELAPVPDPPIRTVVTVTPARAPFGGARAPAALFDDRTSSPDEPRRGPETRTPSVPASSALPPVPLQVEPLTPTVTRLHVSVSPAFLEKLEVARLALSHSLPGASAEDVLSAGLDLLLARDAKRKGLVAKPRPAPPEDEAMPGAPNIPAAVKRAVWKRDDGCCQFPLDSGGVCGSRLDVQFDHLDMRVDGGKPTVANTRVACGFHDRLAARLRLGNRLMNRYCRDPRQVELGDGTS